MRRVVPPLSRSIWRNQSARCRRTASVPRAVSLRLEPAAARAAQDDDDDDDDDNDRDGADADDDDDGDHVTGMFHDVTRTDSIALISSRRQQEYKRGRKQGGDVLRGSRLAIFSTRRIHKNYCGGSVRYKCRASDLAPLSFLLNFD